MNTSVNFLINQFVGLVDLFSRSVHRIDNITVKVKSDNFISFLAVVDCDVKQQINVVDCDVKQQIHITLHTSHLFSNRFNFHGNESLDVLDIDQIITLYRGFFSKCQI